VVAWPQTHDDCGDTGLALNMVLTGAFIWLVKRLMWYVPLVAPLMAPPLHVARGTKVQKKV
jgi:hypothetical protein